MWLAVCHCAGVRCWRMITYQLDAADKVTGSDGKLFLLRLNWTAGFPQLLQRPRARLRIHKNSYGQEHRLMEQLVNKLM